MGFEIFIPNNRFGPSLVAGKARFSVCDCRLNLHVSDVQAVKMATDVVTLIDLQTKRLAFRAPREGEPFTTLSSNKSKTSRTVRIGGALKTLGIEPANVARELDVLRKDDLLIVQLAELATAK